MSSATTIHDGCWDIINLLLSCIILIIFILWESDIAAFAHVSLFYIRYTFLIKKGRILCKNTKIGWNTCQILSFSVCGNPKNTQSRLWIFTCETLVNYLANRPWMLPVNGRFVPVLTFPPFLNKKAWNLLTILPHHFGMVQ